MDDTQMKCLEKCLPKGYRIKWIPADLEGPANIVVYFPDIFRFEVTVRKKLGIFPVWESFGYTLQYWPLNTDNKIILTNVAHKETLENALKRAKLDKTISVVLDSQPKQI